jgi:hypothetical protein
MAKTIAAKNELGLIAEAPMLAEANDVRLVGRHTTPEDNEVNLSLSFTMMLYASGIPSASLFIL